MSSGNVFVIDRTTTYANPGANGTRKRVNSTPMAGPAESCAVSTERPSLLGLVIVLLDRPRDPHTPPHPLLHFARQRADSPLFLLASGRVTCQRT